MSSAPPTEPPATSASPADPRARAWPKRFVAGLLDATFYWPGGRWPVPKVRGALAVAALIVAGVELLPRALSDVTLTVRARTEVLTLELESARTYVWWLPAGSYSLLTATEPSGCALRGRHDVICEFGQPTALTIKNGATVRFELASQEGEEPPSFSVALGPSAREGPQASLFEIREHGAEVPIATGELLTFESQPVGKWRIPLLVERVQIGESLTEAVAAADALDPLARQPIMVGGDVRMFARALWFDERFQVKEERFDPADVVQLPADAANRERLLGLLSLDAAAQREFDVTLHTDLAEVFVRRLGAEHRIGLSMWAVVSRLPIWLAFWVVFVSLIVVFNYYAARLREHRGQK
jgi:hypothetical protein